MKEGWFEDDYFIIFDENESAIATSEYHLSASLDGFEIVGIIGWDDFILCKGDSLYSVPAVPISSEYLQALNIKSLPDQLEADERLSGKIKWYITPLIFGGDANAQDNLAWVNHGQHRELVRYWNNQYKMAKS